MHTPFVSVHGVVVSISELEMAVSQLAATGSLNEGTGRIVLTRVKVENLVYYNTAVSGIRAL